MKELHEELTAKMHSEFNVSPEVEIKLTAGTLWSVVGFECTDKELSKWCNIYGITIEQAKNWKAYWQRFKYHKKSTAKNLSLQK